jgi:hypothetical protein
MRVHGTTRGATRICSVLGITLLVGAVVAGCDQGPAQKTGSKIDRALDRLSGKGPVEKAGERIDKAVEELKK